MRRFPTGWTCLAALVVCAFTLVACQPPTVEQLRQNYEAELNSWYQEDTPAVAEDAITVTDAAGEGAAEDTGAEATAATADGEEGADGEIDAAGPDATRYLNLTSDVTLDILLSHEGAGTLPGITLDVYQAGADEQEKGNWKLWVDTSTMAGPKQVTHTLEGVELDDGDQFAVEIRATVPEGERQEYREFSMHSG